MSAGLVSTESGAIVYLPTKACVPARIADAATIPGAMARNGRAPMARRRRAGAGANGRGDEAPKSAISVASCLASRLADSLEIECLTSALISRAEWLWKHRSRSLRPTWTPGRTCQNLMFDGFTRLSVSDRLAVPEAALQEPSCDALMGLPKVLDRLQQSPLGPPEHTPVHPAAVTVG